MLLQRNYNIMLHELTRTGRTHRAALDNAHANTIDDAMVNCRRAGRKQIPSNRCTYQAQQPVCIEDKVSLVGLDVPDDGVHASGLVVAGHNLKVMVDAAQVWLLQLHAYMLGYQIDCNHILLPTGHSSAVECSG